MTEEDSKRIKPREEVGRRIMGGKERYLMGEI